jgi:hypothetical protein
VLRRLGLLAPLLAAAIVGLPQPAHAGSLSVFSSLSPADGEIFEQTATHGIPFALTGAPALSPVYVVVSRTPSLTNADAIDFVGMSANLAEPGAYRGLSKIGGWASVPGTYYWQARAVSTGTRYGPVRRIVITRAAKGLPMLRRSAGRSAARSHLRDEFASYRRGRARRMRCGRVSRVHVRCRVSWRFHGLRYAGRVEVTAHSEEELIAESRIRRRA